MEKSHYQNIESFAPLAGRGSDGDCGTHHQDTRWMEWQQRQNKDFKSGFKVL